MLGQQISVFAQPIARSLDLEDDGVMQEAVEQRGGDNRIAEDFSPFRKAAVGGEDHRAFLVASVDELEEQVAAAQDHRQVADLVDDEQREAAEVPDLLA